MPSQRSHAWTLRCITRDGTPLRVLVVDDNHNAAEALAMYLLQENMDCRLAFSGRQAIELGTSWVPHIIVMDISMPDCTGSDAARTLRSNPRTAGIVIIAFTAIDETELRRHADEREFDGYCQKGQSPTSLVRLIAGFTRERNAAASANTTYFPILP